jgi:hypothetical protein
MLGNFSVSFKTWSQLLRFSRSERFIIIIIIISSSSSADPSGRAVSGVGFRPSGCWNRC